MREPKLTESRDPSINIMNIGELWEALEIFARKRVEDNKNTGKYPTSIRIIQMDYLKIIIKEIELFHEKIEKE